MKIGTELFHSRFARRLIGVFVLASILPVLALTLLSLNSVTEQLLEQQKEYLHQEAKSIGMSTFEKLTFLSTEIQTVSNYLNNNKHNATPSLPLHIVKAIEGKFKSISWISTLTTFNLFGSVDKNITDQIQKMHDSGSQRIEIISYQVKNGTSRLFMLINSPINNGNHTVLIAEINKGYLWAAQTLQDGHNLCIVDAKILLHCQQAVSDQLFQELNNRLTQAISDDFRWKHKGIDYVSIYWSIFLKSRFSASDWTVVLTTPRDSALYSITAFQSSFFIVVSSTLLLVLILSIRQIRKIIDPLKKLTDATKNIGNIQFDNKVIINSNDEFSDLSDAFNSMSKKLSQQFHSIETMAEIDRLILSSLDSKDIVQTVLTRTQDVIHCDHICIALPNNEGEFEEIHTKGLKFDSSTTTSITLSQEDKDTFYKYPQGIDIYLRKHPPSYLHSLKTKELDYCLVTPLFLEDKLSALIVFAYQQQPVNRKQILIEARSWADRISVALSNASWQEKLYYQAHYDVLTGLPNRFALKDYLKQALEYAKRDNTNLAVLFIDLDRFKLINDSLGHTIGDQYLREISKRISQSVRNTDMVAR